MKYVNSIYTPDLSGKQGGVIFSSNQYGKYSCQRRIPIDPYTISQQNSRAGTREIAPLWSKLTPEQRLVWVEKAKSFPFVKKGKTYFLTPFIFFMKLNKTLYEVGTPLILDYPSGKIIKPQTFEQFSVQMINTPSGYDILMFFDPAIKSTTKLSLFATMPVKSSEQFGTHKRYKIAVLDSSFVSGSSIKDLYIQKYTLLPGSSTKAFFEIKSTDTISAFSSPSINCETLGI